MMKTSRHFKSLLLFVAAVSTTLTTAQASTPAALPNEVVVNGVEFVLIPEGWFHKAKAPATAGGSKNQDEPRIWLDNYYIGKYEARAKDLVAFLNSPNGSQITYGGIGKSCSVGREDNGEYIQFRPDDNLPATHLSWEQADAWSRWMGFRLPTELEWEKAARGSDKRRYPWGDTYPDETFLNFHTKSECSVERVDRYKKGVSPYGLFNMSGNVYEYVADWLNEEFDQTLTNGMKNPAAPDTGTARQDKGSAASNGPWKLLKGGRWGSDVDFVQIGSRMPTRPDHIFRCNGTRFAIDAERVRQLLANGKAEIVSLQGASE